MKKVLVAVVGVMMLVVSGCATTSGTAKTDDVAARVSDLDTRLGAAEQKLATLESRGDSARSYEGAEVRTPLTKIEVQIALKNAGFYEGPVDGKIGALTKQAVEDFQRANNLKVDGVAGAQTEKKLREFLK